MILKRSVKIIKLIQYSNLIFEKKDSVECGIPKLKTQTSKLKSFQTCRSKQIKVKLFNDLLQEEAHPFGCL